MKNNKMRLLAEAKCLTSYTSGGGLTSKMWILPDGRAVSFGTHHYEWALSNAARLREHYGIHLSKVHPQEDTHIRLHLLSKGCVRVNYEHRGGRLMFEANGAQWGARLKAACRAIIEANLSDIYFVELRLLTRSGRIARQVRVNLMELGWKLRLLRLPT